MSFHDYLRGLGLGLLAAICLTAPASASILSETDMKGHAFGRSWDKPTEIGAGITGITGTGAKNGSDNFVFSALPKGAQTITLEFTAPEGINWSYSAGGTALFAETPFRWSWDGTTLGQFHLDRNSKTVPLSLVLSETFGGQLYLALNFTHGKDISYALSVPSNALVATAPAPVPVPAGILLIGTALGGIALIGARSRRRPA